MKNALWKGAYYEQTILRLSNGLRHRNRRHRTPSPTPDLQPRAQKQALQILENASLALGYERCRTALYQNTLEGLGVLSLTAGQLSKLTPQAEEHYWKIVESYANQARKCLERW